MIDDNKYLAKFLLDYSFCCINILVLFIRIQVENNTLPASITGFSVINSTGITLQTVHNLLMRTTKAARVNLKVNLNFG